MYANKQWLTTKDVLREFDFSLSFQAKLRSQTNIPYSKIGRKVLYCREELNSWIKDHDVSGKR